MNLDPARPSTEFLLRKPVGTWRQPEKEHSVSGDVLLRQSVDMRNDLVDVRAPCTFGRPA